MSEVPLQLKGGVYGMQALQGQWPKTVDARSPSTPGSTGMLPLLKTLFPDPVD